MNDSWVKLYRKTLESPALATNNNAYIMFTKLLLKVDWRTGVVTLGRKQLAHLCNMKEATAYRTTLYLLDNRLITTLPNTKFTQITVVNWKKYQGDNANGEQLGNRLVTDSVKKVSTNIRRKKKNIYNRENEKISDTTQLSETDRQKARQKIAELKKTFLQKKGV